MTANQQLGVGVLGVGALALIVKRGLMPLPASTPPLVGTVETWEGFDLSPYGGPTSYPQPIQQMAIAIAKQEGFYVTGSIPQRANNPGDLKIPNTSTLPGTSITAFQSVSAGWDALYHQLMLIVTGQSSYYNLDMTIEQMSRVWTVTQQQPWASNVASQLGVSTQAPLWQVLT